MERAVPGGRRRLPNLREPGTQPRTGSCATPRGPRRGSRSARTPRRDPTSRRRRDRLSRPAAAMTGRRRGTSIEGSATESGPDRDGRSPGRGDDVGEPVAVGVGERHGARSMESPKEDRRRKPAGSISEKNAEAGSGLRRGDHVGFAVSIGVSDDDWRRGTAARREFRGSERSVALPEENAETRIEARLQGRHVGLSVEVEVPERRRPPAPCQESRRRSRTFRRQPRGGSRRRCRWSRRDPETRRRSAEPGRSATRR